MRQRLAGQTIQKLAANFPVITVSGPRQSGKTSLTRNMFPDHEYVSLDNMEAREFAENDPRGFLDRFRNGVILDEPLRCPILLSFLRDAVDSRPVPGRFILITSHRLLPDRDMPSLIGLMARCTVLAPGLEEYENQPLADELDTAMFRGAYPAMLDQTTSPVEWYGNYIRTFIEQDARSMTNIRDLSAFERFVRICAASSGMLLNLSGMASDCGITHNTARAWLEVLENAYLVFRLYPLAEGFKRRVVKAPKLYFYDSGLAARLLSIVSVEQLGTHPMRGALFEGFIISDAIKGRVHRGQDDALHFWRDRTGNEADLLIPHGDKLQPVEIKSGKTLNRDYFKGLRKWLSLAGNIAVDPCLIYGGDFSGQREGVTVSPWNAPCLH